MSADAGHGQLRLLLGMRWRMLREPKQRRRVAIAFALLPLLIVAAVIVGQLAPDEFRFNFALLAPTVYASFFALTVISPASSAGGSELRSLGPSSGGRRSSSPTSRPATSTARRARPSSSCCTSSTPTGRRSS